MEQVRFSAILPKNVYCSEQSGPFQGTLTAEESSLLGAAAIGKRRLEFAAGRTCARAAMLALGASPASVLQGKHREPLWPTGIVGSITHCADYCASAVALIEHYSGLGLDVELNRPLPSGVLDLISLRREREWLASQGEDGHIHWDRLLFSVKEVVFKIWYPLEGNWLGFEEAEIELQSCPGLFQATVLRPGSRCPPVIHGRFITSDTHILSFASVPALEVSSQCP